MQETELPDAERLKELRQEGQFPYSKFTVRCVTSAVLLAVTYFQFPGFVKLIELVQKMYSEPVTNFAAVKMQIYELVEMLSFIFSIYAVVFIISFVLIVFLQSKFYFSLVNIAFNLSQIVRIHKASLGFFFLTTARGIFGVLFGLLIGAAFLYWLSRQLLSILYSKEFFVSGPLNMQMLLDPTKSLLAVCIFSLLLLATVSYLGARFFFLRKHRSAGVRG